MPTKAGWKGIGSQKLVDSDLPFLWIGVKEWKPTWVAALTVLACTPDLASQPSLSILARLKAILDCDLDEMR